VSLWCLGPAVLARNGLLSVSNGVDWVSSTTEEEPVAGSTSFPSCRWRIPRSQRGTDQIQRVVSAEGLLG